MTRSFLFSLIFQFLCVSVVSAKLQERRIQLGEKSILVEIAKTDEEQQKGLMYRKSLPKDRGMLFVFNDLEVRRFWMKNTFIPLSIAYFDENQVLIDIIDMEPVKSEMAVNLPYYESSKPAKYALEMNQGWFEENKISKGTKLKLSTK